MNEIRRVSKALREWDKHRNRMIDTGKQRDISRVLRDPSYFAQAHALLMLENDHFKRTMQALQHLIKVAGYARTKRLISERLRNHDRRRDQATNRIQAV